MKKFIALSLTVLSFSSIAGTSADLLLKGTVAEILDISIQHETIASNLDLSQPASNVKVGTVTEKSNHVAGYRVLARSAKNGRLTNTIDANSFVNYTLTYAGSNVPLNINDNEVFTTSSLRGVFTKELKVSYPVIPANLSAGSYEDTVTFTIVKN